eukprot:TRINITY_DN3022_c0_g2_i1.p1 TRINITY_DN3022_c0_g2~~TRINITY_DN3022_c0_g2_i1.p1  ORF type:complete len:187 (+),score=74.93 TRINITY_DN3022_c0_g2_i1:46-561(+)
MNSFTIFSILFVSLILSVICAPPDIAGTYEVTKISSNCNGGVGNQFVVVQNGKSFAISGGIQGTVNNKGEFTYTQAGVTGQCTGTFEEKKNDFIMDTECSTNCDFTSKRVSNNDDNNDNDNSNDKNSNDGSNDGSFSGSFDSSFSGSFISSSSSVFSSVLLTFISIAVFIF